MQAVQPVQAGKISARVFQINVSGGGVPKQAVRQAEISSLGLSGDKQANTEVHGGPERAVCLYSLERVLALQAEGHPIYPGAIGENLTLAGLDWESLLPGIQVRVGEQILLEITRYTSPCQKIGGSFIAEDFSRVSQKTNPGWSRLYARVLQPGPVQVGDLVQVVFE
jgi:MOSC domain-containing protein YiiM